VSMCRLGSSVKRPSSPRKNCMKTRFLHGVSWICSGSQQIHCVAGTMSNWNSYDIPFRLHPSTQLPYPPCPNLDDIGIICIHQSCRVSAPQSIIVQLWARSTRALKKGYKGPRLQALLAASTLSTLI
jgi:hypothetical protein